MDVEMYDVSVYIDISMEDVEMIDTPAWYVRLRSSERDSFKVAQTHVWEQIGDMFTVQ